MGKRGHVLVLSSCQDGELTHLGVERLEDLHLLWCGHCGGLDRWGILAWPATALWACRESDLREGSFSCLHPFEVGLTRIMVLRGVARRNQVLAGWQFAYGQGAT